MKNICYFAIITSLLFFSCKNEPVTPQAKVDKETLNPNWTKLTILEGRGAYAIAGNIDDTLLVTTLTKSYFTTDKGKTWQISRDFQGPIEGLLTSKDSVISLTATTWAKGSNIRYALIANYFTTNLGKTWQPYFKPDASDRIKQIGFARSGLVSYAIPIEVNSSNIVSRKKILKTQNGTESLLSFPFERSFNNLFIDTNNRLYVAAEGMDYSGEDKTRYDKLPAIIYVSKKPLP